MIVILFTVVLVVTVLELVVSSFLSLSFSDTGKCCVWSAAMVTAWFLDQWVSGAGQVVGSLPDPDLRQFGGWGPHPHFLPLRADWRSPHCQVVSGCGKSSIVWHSFMIICLLCRLRRLWLPTQDAFCKYRVCVEGCAGVGALIYILLICDSLLHASVAAMFLDRLGA